jgi:hypothetical protein
LNHLISVPRTALKKIGEYINWCIYLERSSKKRKIKGLNLQGPYDLVLYLKGDKFQNI